MGPSEVQKSLDLSQELGLQIVTQLVLSGPHMVVLLPVLHGVSGEQHSFEEDNLDPKVTLSELPWGA